MNDLENVLSKESLRMTSNEELFWWHWGIFGFHGN